MIELTLPYPPSANRYWRWVKGRMLVSREALSYRQAVGLAVIVAGRPRAEGRLAVDIEAHPPDGRQRDLDNTLKCMLDALALAGVYEDDSQVDDLRIRRCERQEGGRVVVRVRELK